MKILITGADGFIGKNVKQSFINNKFTINTITRNSTYSDISEKVYNADIVIHLAGENRAVNNALFTENNVRLTEHICNALQNKPHQTPIIFTSSTQSGLPNPYGKSKLICEKIIEDLHHKTNNPAIIYQLPGVFGKWSKPNYNSVVATFCHNIANDLPVQIIDPEKVIDLVYIDDVVQDIYEVTQQTFQGLEYRSILPKYSITIEKLAHMIEGYKKSQSDSFIDSVGIGFSRALYATYISFCPKEKIVFEIPQHSDSRGKFVEIFKTSDSGQFSYISANPGITRGGHFHHTKTEKFLVVNGSARFKFRHIITNETFEVYADHLSPKIIQTIPGWAHDITNVGNDQLIAFIWSNEVFNPYKPDTIKWEIE